MHESLLIQLPLLSWDQNKTCTLLDKEQKGKEKERKKERINVRQKEKKTAKSWKDTILFHSDFKTHWKQKHKQNKLFWVIFLFTFQMTSKILMKMQSIFAIQVLFNQLEATLQQGFFPSFLAFSFYVFSFMKK